MCFRQLLWLYQQVRQFVYHYIILVLTSLLCLALTIEFIDSHNLATKLVETQAQQYASHGINILNQVNDFYSKTVAAPLQSIDGVILTSRYHNIEGGVPIPTTFSIELGEQLSDRSKGSLFRIYSDYPFPHRELTGGPKDAFEREALRYLREAPFKSFSRKETINNRQTFRYAEAVRMKTSCIQCHNTLASSPKKDWQVGDVRGVITVTQPIDQALLLARSSLQSTYATSLAITALAFLGFILVIDHLRLNNLKLENTVTARTMELDHLAHTDALTQISNRRHFDQALDEEWRRAIRSAQSLSLLICDVDHFKAFNDTYGHQAGDDCLKTVAQILKRSARRAGDVVARYGGEEFALILPNTESHQAIDVATLIRDRLRARNIEHSTSLIRSQVTLSIGIATVAPCTVHSATSLVEAADQALYEAKAKGRDRYILWHGGGARYKI